MRGNLRVCPLLLFYGVTARTFCRWVSFLVFIHFTPVGTSMGQMKIALAVSALTSASAC